MIQRVLFETNCHVTSSQVLEFYFILFFPSFQKREVVGVSSLWRFTIRLKIIYPLVRILPFCFFIFLPVKEIKWKRKGNLLKAINPRYFSVSLFFFFSLYLVSSFLHSHFVPSKSIQFYWLTLPGFTPSSLRRSPPPSLSRRALYSYSSCLRSIFSYPLQSRYSEEQSHVCKARNWICYAARTTGLAELCYQNSLTGPDWFIIRTD